MPQINILPKHLAELIAAGEVVERPASIVKEIMENAIDAGADKITLEIQRGGITYIRITDNGCGIERTEIRKAFVSHATSKIAKITVEAPVVKYLSDGTIDSANSYVMIQDQRAGGSTSFFEVVNGVEIAYSGRLSAQYTFDKLLEKHYIPVTAAEFTSEKPYENAAVTVSDQNCSSIAALADITVEANYPLAVINILSVDAFGKQTVLKKAMFGGASMHGVPRSYKLSEIADIENLSPATGCTIKLEVVVSTGERFYPIEFKA